MSFKIKERFLLGKKGLEQYCEDRIVVLPHGVAVIDGATSKSSFSFEGKSTGRMAVELIEQALYHIPATYDRDTAIAAINAEIQAFYREQGMDQHVKTHATDRLTASLVLYNHHFGEVWLVGDCQCLIGEQYYSHEKKVDTVLAKTRALFLENELLQGKSLEALLQHDSGREFILPLLKAQSRFQNPKQDSTYAYAVIDGFPPYVGQVKNIPVDDARIVLASDGYPQLYNNLDASEAYLEYVLAHDPLCFRLYPSTKGLQEDLLSFDDRAYVKIERKR